MRKLLILLTMSAALGLAGCGGDDDGGTVPTGDVSKEEYIAQANKVCRTVDAQLSQAAGPASARNSASGRTSDRRRARSGSSQRRRRSP
jgi:hypothetical protein